mmetsp:Transcript_30201/g.65225  ORF Transcript_30201/g.65225 Transcript_30201/m.65225 type:complete len:408 (-) Transcript_30201:342-1565(-)
MEMLVIAPLRSRRYRRKRLLRNRIGGNSPGKQVGILHLAFQRSSFSVFDGIDPRGGGLGRKEFVVYLRTFVVDAYQLAMLEGEESYFPIGRVDSKMTTSSPLFARFGYGYIDRICFLFDERVEIGIQLRLKRKWSVMSRSAIFPRGGGREGYVPNFQHAAGISADHPLLRRVIRQRRDGSGVIGDDTHRIGGKVGPRKQENGTRRYHSAIASTVDNVSFLLRFASLGERSILLIAIILLLLLHQLLQPFLLFHLHRPFLPRGCPRRNQEIQILPFDQCRMPPQSKLLRLCVIRADHPTDVERCHVVKFDNSIVPYARCRISIGLRGTQGEQWSHVGGIGFDEFETTRIGVGSTTLAVAATGSTGSSSQCTAARTTSGSSSSSTGRRRCPLPKFHHTVRTSRDDVSVS